MCRRQPSPLCRECGEPLDPGCFTLTCDACLGDYDETDAADERYHIWREERD